MAINLDSPKTKMALEIIRDKSITSPRQFAELIWPDAPGWNVHVRTGPKGVSRGRQMVSSGGAYLARLKRAGLIERYREWSWAPAEWQLTARGKEVLENFIDRK